MKKLVKRLAAALLAAVMTLGISMTAFAEESEGTTAPTTGAATLTVTGSGLWDPAQGDGNGTGKKVTAIRMFTARVTEGDTNSFDSYELETNWYAFFRETSRIEAMQTAGVLETTADTKADSVINSAAVAYIQYLDKQKTISTFAHNAQIWARAHSNDLTSLTKDATATSANDEEDATKGTATFTELGVGYYLVYPQIGSTGTNNRGTDAMLVNVPEKNENTSVEIKSTYPTVDKEVQTTVNGEFAQNGTAQVGDQVTFHLHSTVPDMSDYDEYQFKFDDTLSNGLTFNTGSVKVSIGNKTIVQNDNTYTVTEPSTNNGNKLTITFAKLKTLVESDNDISTGADIVVSYTAHITAAATTTAPAKNTVTVSYSNNPDGSGWGTSQPSESKVYTYQIDIDKYTGDYGDGKNVTRLQGATFQLEATKNGAAIELVKEENNVYHVKGNNESATDTTVTSDGENKITIKGLKAGTYYLEETTAPTGYNKLTEPVTIVIATSDAVDTTVTMTNAKYTVANIANATVGDSTVAVKNNKGATLPTTGSMGTIGLVILGVAVVLIGVFMPRKKKANH